MKMRLLLVLLTLRCILSVHDDHITTGKTSIFYETNNSNFSNKSSIIIHLHPNASSNYGVASPVPIIGSSTLLLQKCIPYKTYCGHQFEASFLRTVRVRNIKQILFHCNEDGAIADMYVCQTGCAIVNGDAFCKCYADNIYCGYEFSQIGDQREYDNNTLYRCTDDGLKVTRIQTCNTACMAEDEKSFCAGQCKANYASCGYNLLELGWSDLDNKTLYLCAESGNNITALKECPNGCTDHYCPCTVGRTYCGYEIYSMGWWKTLSANSLFKCTHEKYVQRIVDCEDQCLSTERGAYCRCEGGMNYCSHELDGIGFMYKNNSLYKCNGQGQAMYMKTCKDHCVKTIYNSFCYGECVPNSTYCGSKLWQFGQKELKNDTLYQCLDDGYSLVATGKRDKCNRCISGLSYCGHELQHIGITTDVYLANDDPMSERERHYRYICNSDGTFKWIVACASCVNRGAGGYCQCVRGGYHCGDNVKLFGWEKFDNVLRLAEFTNDTLFRCKDNNTIERVEQCLKSECRTWNLPGSAHCKCHSGQAYCGHELYSRYNSEDSILYPNHIYMCSKSKETVKSIQICASSCVSFNGMPQCVKECVPNGRYCSNDLLSLDGWSNRSLDPNSLYQCTNGTHVVMELNCTAGCHARTGDDDAYCLGMLVAWYWILTGVAVTMIFIGLAALFVFVIVRHRRLQNIVRQHRIDASQLTVVNILGHGQFGEVWFGMYKDTNTHQIEVAMKISKHSLHAKHRMGLASADCFIQESIALDFLRHRYITKAFGVCSNLKDQHGKTTPALILEYMNGGNSIDYMLSERHRLTGKDLAKILIDICQAGIHLCKMGVIHRDIGARNVLIKRNTDNGKPIVAKLTDFGLAKDIGRKTDQYKSTNPDRAMFHPCYTAPEGFQGEFSFQSDVWSYGVFIWELYMLLDLEQTTAPSPDYSGERQEIIFRNIMNGQRLSRPKLASSDVYATMSDCWLWKPASRPTFSGLLKRFCKNDHWFELEIFASKIEVQESLELQVLHNSYRRIHFTEGGSGYKSPIQESDSTVQGSREGNINKYQCPL